MSSTFCTASSEPAILRAEKLQPATLFGDLDLVTKAGSKKKIMRGKKYIYSAVLGNDSACGHIETEPAQLFARIQQTPTASEHYSHFPITFE